MAKLLIKDGVRIGGGGVRIDTEGVVRHESDTLNPINRIDGGDYDAGTLDVVGPGETGGGEAIHIGAAVLFSGFTVTSVLGLNNGVDINDAGGSFSAQAGVVVGAKLQFSTGTGEVDATIHLIRPGTFNGQAFTRIFFLTNHTGIVAGDTIGLHQNIVRELDAGDGITIDPSVPGGVATIENDWGTIPTTSRYDGAFLKSANLGMDTVWGSPLNQIQILEDVASINIAPGNLFISMGGFYQYNPNAVVNTTIAPGDDLTGFIGPLTESFVLSTILTDYESIATRVERGDQDDFDIHDATDLQVRLTKTAGSNDPTDVATLPNIIDAVNNFNNNFIVDTDIVDDATTLGSILVNGVSTPADILRLDQGDSTVFAFVGVRHLELDGLIAVAGTTPLINTQDFFIDGTVNGLTLGAVVHEDGNTEGYRIGQSIDDLPVGFPVGTALIGGAVGETGYTREQLQFRHSKINVADNELYIEGQRVATRDWVEINASIKAQWDGGQFVQVIDSTEADEDVRVSLIEKRVIRDNNVIVRTLFGFAGSAALTLYTNRDRMAANTVLTQNYTG